MNRLLTTAMVAIFLMAGVFGQDADNRSREAFMKRLYLSTSDDPMAIVKVKMMNDFELQAPQVKKSRKKAGEETVSLVDSSYSYRWDATLQSWKTNPYIENIFRYNANNDVDTLIQNSYQETDSSWIPFTMVVNTYNLQHELLNTYTYKLTINDSTSKYEWANSELSCNTYNTSGNKLSYIYKTWDSENKLWIDSWKHTFYCDSLGNDTSILEQVWDIELGLWINNYKYVYEYDIQNKVTKNITQSWLSDLSTWKNESKIDYNYTIKNNDSVETTQVWDENENLWINSQRRSYSYLNNTRLDKYLDEYWQAITSRWIIRKQGIYDYDSIGNNYKLTEQSYDTTNMLYTTSYIRESVFDSLNNESSQTALYWNAKKNYWGSGTKQVYFRTYHEIIVNPTAIPNQYFDIAVYPNPVCELLIIQSKVNMSFITIIDLSGKVIRTRQIINESNVTFNTTELKAGLYFIKITTANGNTSIQKLIKK